MDVSSYASDLNDAEWALLESLVPRSHCKHSVCQPNRRIVSGVSGHGLEVWRGGIGPRQQIIDAGVEMARDDAA